MTDIEKTAECAVYSKSEKDVLRKLPQYMAVFRVCGAKAEGLFVTDLFLQSIQKTEKEFFQLLRKRERMIYEDDYEHLRETVKLSIAKPDTSYDFTLRIRMAEDLAYMKYKGTIRSVRTAKACSGVTLAPVAGSHIPEIGLDLPDTLVYFSSLDISCSDPLAEKKQRKMSRLLLKEVLGQTRDCIFWKDTQRRFVGVNQAFLDFYGFKSEEEVLGKTDEDMNWHPDPEPFKRDELRVLRGESTMLVHGTCVIRGRVRDILATKAPIYDGQEIVGFVGSFIDVTDDYARRREIERLDQELKKALENERRANQNMTSFVSRMSHELRTPMNAVIGLSSLGMQTNNLETAVEYLHKINASGQYLLGIINDVLDFNKIEGGKFQLFEDNANLADIFAAVDNIIRPLAETKGVHLLIDDNGLVISNAICDALRIEQILINLLNNAVKFTDPDGMVTMQVQQTVVRGRLRMTFLISDTGCGISDEFMSRIFQPFVQENRNPNKYGKGTGLGLAISRTLARQMGGDITVESHINSGTVFTVTILLGIDNGDVHKANQIEANAALERCTVGKRVLIAEDNDLNREVAVGLFSILGIIAECAENGREAVEMFARAPEGYYDAVFMDLTMPIMDGYEVAREIHKMSKKMPLIAMSADVFDASVEKAKKCGMEYYITKPLDKKQIMRVVRSLEQK